MSYNYYIYILQSTINSSYYVGYSTDPWRRLTEHNTSDRNTFTSKYRPWEIKAVFGIKEEEGEAKKAEHFIKKQKSKSLIEMLIDPRFTPGGCLGQLVRVPQVREGSSPEGGAESH